MNYHEENITVSTVDNVVKIHHCSYKDDHFTRLMSDKYIKEYYLSLVKDYNGTALSFLMTKDGVPFGFLICGENLNSEVKKFITKNWLYMFFLVIANPRFLIPKIISDEL